MLALLPDELRSPVHLDWLYRAHGALHCGGPVILVTPTLCQPNKHQRQHPCPLNDILAAFQTFIMTRFVFVLPPAPDCREGWRSAASVPNRPEFVATN